MFTVFSLLLAAASIYVSLKRNNLAFMLGIGNIIASILMVWLLIIAYFESINVSLIDISIGIVILAVSGWNILSKRKK